MSEKESFDRVMKLHYNGPSRNVGFDFCPSSGSDNDPVERCIFIYEDDAEFVISKLRGRYPLIDPENGELQEKFDPCWDNPIPREVWLEIADELEALRIDDPQEAEFVRTFCRWLREALSTHDHVTVTGNL
ncbi:hypothetical protein B9G55_22190 [Saccharibacillus sp. O16]|nr:hypothetical protein B9G55_22190 [Saccharibacillus sp. O16]